MRCGFHSSRTAFVCLDGKTRRGEPFLTSSCALPPRAEPLRKQRDSPQGLSLGMVVFMPDYQEMYLTLFRASEEAVSLLIKAQRECEELYLSAPEPQIEVLEFDPQSPP